MREIPRQALMILVAGGAVWMIGCGNNTCDPTKASHGILSSQCSSDQYCSAKTRSCVTPPPCGNGCADGFACEAQVCWVSCTVANDQTADNGNCQVGYTCELSTGLCRNKVGQACDPRSPASPQCHNPCDAATRTCVATKSCTTNANCAGYGCNMLECLTSCATNADCDFGYTCDPTTAACTSQAGKACSAQSDCNYGCDASTGKCAPRVSCTRSSDCPHNFTCVEQTCVSWCVDNSQCLNNTTCNLSTGLCQ